MTTASSTPNTVNPRRTELLQSEDTAAPLSTPCVQRSRARKKQKAEEATEKAFLEDLARSDFDKEWSSSREANTRAEDSLFSSSPSKPSGTRSEDEDAVSDAEALLSEEDEAIYQLGLKVGWESLGKPSSLKSLKSGDGDPASPSSRPKKKVTFHDPALETHNVVGEQIVEKEITASAEPIAKECNGFKQTVDTQVSERTRSSIKLHIRRRKKDPHLPTTNDAGTEVARNDTRVQAGRQDDQISHPLPEGPRTHVDLQTLEHTAKFLAPTILIAGNNRGGKTARRDDDVQMPMGKSHTPRVAGCQAAWKEMTFGPPPALMLRKHPGPEVTGTNTAIQAARHDTQATSAIHKLSKPKSMSLHASSSNKTTPVTTPGPMLRKDPRAERARNNTSVQTAKQDTNVDLPPPKPFEHDPLDLQTLENSKGFVARRALIAVREGREFRAARQNDDADLLKHELVDSASYPSTGPEGKEFAEYMARTAGAWG